MNNLYFRYSIKLLLLLFLHTYSSNIYATAYYVSSSRGDDGRSMKEASTEQTPWRTIARVNAVMQELRAGDQVLFKRGEQFLGTLTLTVSGAAGVPIVFGAYGEGALPELTGFVQLSGWQQKGGNIWETTVPGGLSYVNTVTVKGAGVSVGRYPNAGAANQGYLTFESYNGSSSVTDSKLASLPNWNGGQVVIRKNRWILDRNEITGQAGTTIYYNSASGYGAAKGYGYFIQNHPAVLDQQGEWYYRAAGNRLGIYSSGNPENYAVKAGVRETLVSISGQSNLSFENLRLSGAALSAFEITSSQNIRISGCEILFSGKNALNASNSTGLSVENSTISHTGNNALSVNNCTGTVLRNNQIRSTGVNAGMGDPGDGSCEGITISGENNVVANNTIDSTGYVPLNFSGNNVLVKNNVISNFALTKDDGGGIYTWNNSANAPANSGRVITGNIVLNGTGAPGGTDDSSKGYAHGIYIDDNAAQVEISGNTVANCASYGIYIHNAHDISIKQNTLYNNAVQLMMEHDNVAADKPVYNNTVTGNILFAKQTWQLAASYKTKDNDIANFGSFNQNYYYRPLDDDLTIGVLQQVNGVYRYQEMSLESWKALYGKDGSSVRSARGVPSYTISKVTGTNQYGNGSFERDAGGLYAYASANNCAATWASSSVLDGGSLKVSFSSASGSASYGSVIIGIGAVTAGKSYRLKFSMLGANSYKAITTYLRQSGGSYSDLSERKAATISGTRQEKEFVFTASASESNASIVLDVPEQPSPLYLDNIILEPVEAAAVNIDQYISFFYNPNSVGKAFSTTQSFDAAGNSYPNSVKLEPFSSVVLVHDTAAAITTTPVKTSNCSATGTILREQWDNVGGTSITDIPLQKAAASSSQLTSFEGPKDVADNYGSRIRGYICAPQTGKYTFWLASDDAGELWLSTDDNPANKVRIANVDGYTDFREWNRYSSQKSTQITLEAGKKYYIEALQKDGGGGDHLSVQWQLPDATMETPIAGNHLSPFVDTATPAQPAKPVIAGTGTITREQWDNAGGNNIADIPLQKTASSTSALTSFEGPKDVADNYGSRIRGYIYPPKTGKYIFWLASDDAGELWLSTDDNPKNKVRIANVSGYTDFREWNRFSSQKSISINLEAGKKYYVEALQKDGIGGDHLSVQWQLPDATMETPIAGNHLAPYTAAPLTDQTISFAAVSSKTIGDAPFALTATASSGLAVIYRVVSGSATVSGSTITISGDGNVVIAADQAGDASFNAAKTVTQSFVVLPANTACSATGTILRELWSNVSGNNITDIPLQTAATSTSLLTAFEGPANIGDSYASRIRGYICAPQTGRYTFWLAADDAAELYLSTDENPGNKVRIANLFSWTNYREWDKFATQKSATVTLQAGKKYYIEALHKQGAGGDNLSVQWQLPNGVIEAPLPGKYLSPYPIEKVQFSSFYASSNGIAPVSATLAEPLSVTVKQGLSVFPNPVSQQSNVEFVLTESGKVDVALYNTKGQFISKLFSGMAQANTKNTIVFDAGTLQNGAYIIRLTSGSNSLSKKVIVMK
jgi:parallel beta-helix repeat protein